MDLILEYPVESACLFLTGTAAIFFFIGAWVASGKSSAKPKRDYRGRFTK
jgi:hypothetical protein